MANRNFVELIGHCGADPVVKKTGNGQDYASVNIATTDNYKKDGEWVNITDWHSIVAWRDNAKKLAGAKKGSPVLVIGKMKTRKYTDKDGIEKYITEVIADDIVLLVKDAKPETHQSDQQQSGKQQSSGSNISMM